MPAGAILRLMRPKQWSKNLLVFAGLLFTASFVDSELTIRAFLAFLAMCLASSGTYALNDVNDAERDRRHPKKKHRPVAAGLVSPAAAIVVGTVLMTLGVALAFLLNRDSGFVMAAYLALQLLYNGALKRIAVADVFGLSIGFVLRAVLGATCIEVSISGWLLFCTGALALLLGFAKRRHEFRSQGEERESTRAALGHYSETALDALVIVSACIAALCYGIYSLESPTAETHPALFLTTPFVFYGICRYVLLVFSFDEGGEPENVLWRDPHVLFSVIGFVVAAILAMKGIEVPWVDGGGR